MKPISPYIWPGVAMLRGYNAPDRIIGIVCDYYGASLNDIFLNTRNKRIVRLRHICWFLIRYHNKKVTLKQLGKIFGRDHSTVILGLRSFGNDLENEDDLDKDIEILSRRIKMA